MGDPQLTTEVNWSEQDDTRHDQPSPQADLDDPGAYAENAMEHLEGALEEREALQALVKLKTFEKAHQVQTAVGARQGTAHGITIAFPEHNVAVKRAISNLLDTYERLERIHSEKKHLDTRVRKYVVTE